MPLTGRGCLQDRRSHVAKFEFHRPLQDRPGVRRPPAPLKTASGESDRYLWELLPSQNYSRALPREKEFSTTTFFYHRKIRGTSRAAIPSVALAVRNLSQATVLPRLTNQSV